MRLTSKGQVTIPQGIRQLAGLLPGSEVEFQYKNGQVVLEKVEVDAATQRRRIEAAIDAVAGSATLAPSLRTDDIMRMTRSEDGA
jgi:antitoxin PrlF